MAESRTKKSLRNSYVALCFFAVELILKFFSRKIFLEYLGTEILGLNTTASNILEFLNLAELGIGAAVGFSLYRPIYEDDKVAVSEIVSLQGHLYRRIATWIMIGASVVMCFFPWIFHKITLPLWYAYASFLVLLMSALIGYYVNYKQIVLTASQQDYKVQYSTKSWSILKVICQMTGMALFSFPYFWWLLFQGLFSIISAINLSYVIKKNYPWLRSADSTYGHLKEKYRMVFIKIKQVFFHKIGAFALTRTSPLIIYAYMSLSVVAIYGNYLIIVFGLTAMCNAVFNSVGAGIGNLIAEGNGKKVWNVFVELFSLRFFIGAVMMCGFISLTQPFVSLWIGKEYLLPIETCILIGVQLFISISRNAVENFISAYGLYSDVWAPIVEASLNIGLSVLLGYFWGLNGILLGVIISLVLIILVWKPYYLFTRGMQRPFVQYILLYFKHILLFIVSMVIIRGMIHYTHVSADTSWVSFIIFAISDMLCFCCLFGFMLCITKCGLENFLRRMRRIVK